MTANKTMTFAVCAAALALSATAFSADPAARAKPQKRWVYMFMNLSVDENIPKIEAILTRAKKAGYNGLFINDNKVGFWWKLENAQGWKANAEKLRKLTKAIDFELVVGIFPFGRAESLLWHDVNLASGMPVIAAPLTARNGRLVPDATAAISNGSFEEHAENVAAGFDLQDGPGVSSFIDTQNFKTGKASLRFENAGAANKYGNGRISQKIHVKPWQQYRLRAYMKTDQLTADEVKLMAMANGRTLQHQFIQVPDGKGLRAMESANSLTTDWIEQSVTFNSLDNTEVSIYAGVWGGQSGKIWWDDLRIDAAPLMNVLRRESLPLTLKTKTGAPCLEGKDFTRVVDTRLGVVPWPGSYDTRHEPPEIRLTRNSRIKEGQTVWLSCHHTVIVRDGEVNCSMAEPETFELCKQQIRKTKEALAPNGYFMSHDEIRSGGWEPVETNGFKTAGDLFAFNIRRCYEIAAKEGGGKPVYVWSDMFDPNHNAHTNYYLVNNTLENSWSGLNPQVTVMNWRGGEKAGASLNFFAKRGNPQMIAAYYDGDVEQNHRMWTDAMRDVPGIAGVMYTTWNSNYENLERFAETWWGGEAPPNSAPPARARKK
jgi:hypothetical protein